MEPKNWQDVLWQSMNAIRSTNATIDSLYNDLDSQIANLNGIKPIHFKTPEKLNGRYERNGESLEVMFIGRDLSLAKDNWTWLVKELNSSNREHKLSILKYPTKTGYATIVKNAYGLESEQDILINTLYNIEWMRRELVTLIDLPF